MDTDLLFEAIGWCAALILLSTIVQQVWKQWQSGEVSGVSKWLFAGQALASLGFSVYSWHTGNWVFLTVNVCLLVSELVGQAVYWRNRRRRRQGARRPAAGEGRVAQAGG